MELKVQTPQQNLGTPSVAEVVSDIAQMLKRLQRNVVIGISGRGGAGKSTVVEELCTRLYDWSVEPLVLHVDDFVFPKAVRDANPDRAKARYYESYDFATLFDRLLRPMKNSASYVAEVPVLDRAEDRQVPRRIAMSGPTPDRNVRSECGANRGGSAFPPGGRGHLRSPNLDRGSI